MKDTKSFFYLYLQSMFKLNTVSDQTEYRMLKFELSEKHKKICAIFLMLLFVKYIHIQLENQLETLL